MGVPEAGAISESRCAIPWHEKNNSTNVNRLIAMNKFLKAKFLVTAPPNSDNPSQGNRRETGPQLTVNR
jgi:hypothetical protein